MEKIAPRVISLCRSTNTMEFNKVKYIESFGIGKQNQISVQQGNVSKRYIYKNNEKEGARPLPLRVHTTFWDPKQSASIVIPKQSLIIMQALKYVNKNLLIKSL